MSSVTPRPFGRLGVEQLESRDVPSSVLAAPTFDGSNLPDLEAARSGDTSPKSADSDRFVTHLYQDVLGRSPEPSGLAYWSGRLDAGLVSRGQLSIFFISSDEYRTNTIRSYFEAQLGRSPEAVEVQYFMNRLIAGESQDALRVTFFGSEEFFNRYSRNSGEFVSQLYQQVLGRTAAIGEINYWVGVLAQTNGDRTFVASQFLTSVEYKQLQVFGTYSLLLKRAPDAVGFAYWTQQRVNGVTMEAMVAGFLASDEYYLRA